MEANITNILNSKVPAACLAGLKLLDKWTVTEQFARPETTNEGFTGGRFSFGYKAVDDDGNEVFVKALDFSGAQQRATIFQEPLADVLKTFLDEYIFERDLCIQASKLSRIVTTLGHGNITLDENNPLNTTVYFLIYELADGDIRKHLSEIDFNDAWNLWALHDIAIGLHQLHKVGVSHSDTKPSNTLVFNKKNIKLGDLGSATTKNGISPKDNWGFSGDPIYKPINLNYRHSENLNLDWNIKRQTCDLYHLGNMAVFLFCDTNINALIEDQLDYEDHWHNYTGTFENILPTLKVSFAKALGLLATDIPQDIREDLCQMIQVLCNPDPTQRTWKTFKHRQYDKHSLEPFIGKISSIAIKASRGIRLNR